MHNSRPDEVPRKAVKNGLDALSASLLSLLSFSFLCFLLPSLFECILASPFKRAITSVGQSRYRKNDRKSVRIPDVLILVIAYFHMYHSCDLCLQHDY